MTSIPASAATMEIRVTDHAQWRAAERFPWFDTSTIEAEVRAALVAGRCTTDRTIAGLARFSDPESVYVWTEDGERVYALKASLGSAFFVTTTMRKGMQG